MAWPKCRRAGIATRGTSPELFLRAACRWIGSLSRVYHFRGQSLIEKGASSAIGSYPACQALVDRGSLHAVQHLKITLPVSSSTRTRLDRQNAPAYRGGAKTRASSES
jgi:hypothetical protein